MARQITIKDHEEFVARFRRSGMTQREFCEEEGITLGTLQYWLYREKRTGPSGPRFVDVTTPPTVVEPLTIEVRLGELRVVLPAAISNERIVDLVVALERRARSSR